VFGQEWVEPLARVLGLLGAERAWVVHGSDGLDELTTAGVSDVAVLDAGRVSTFKISPRNAGLPEARPEDLTGGNAIENAAHIRAVLQGMQGPFRDVVLLNAAAALLVAGKAKTLREGVALAAESIDSGKAMGVLDALVTLSHARV
jgi:anthranilate phosphoribosyltransferase